MPLVGDPLLVWRAELLVEVGGGDRLRVSDRGREPKHRLALVAIRRPIIDICQDVKVKIKRSQRTRG